MEMQCRRRVICPTAAFAKGGDNEEHLEVSCVVSVFIIPYRVGFYYRKK